MSKAKSGVVLKNNRSASGIFHEVLSLVCDQIDPTPGLQEWLISADSFRKHYVSRLPEFEAHRLCSPQRHAIARQLSKAVEDNLVWDVDKQQSLHEYLQQPVAALSCEVVVGEGSSLWTPAFEYGDKQWLDFSALGTTLVADNVITPAAADSLAAIAKKLEKDDGLSLKGRKVVVIGAAAEMASTRHFLAMGAEVLWLDQAAPPKELKENPAFSGILHYPSENVDLLTQPAELMATIIAFSAGSACDICLYAYAPGQARELRLTGVMNAIINAMPSELMASVTMLVSPTTPSELQVSDRDLLEQRLAQRPKWEGLLDTFGVLGKMGGVAQFGERSTIRSVVSIQGASYQAAQYLCKVIMAEAWATHGQIHADNVDPLRVSANTAAITKTRSLDHPVFDAAFGGAAAMQVQTFSPEQSKCLNALLAVQDWLSAEIPVPGRVRVHGGIHTLPYPLQSALRPAAVIGFAKAPKLLAGLLK